MSKLDEAIGKVESAERISRLPQWAQHLLEDCARENENLRELLAERSFGESNISAAHSLGGRETLIQGLYAPRGIEFNVGGEFPITIRPNSPRDATHLVVSADTQLVVLPKGTNRFDIRLESAS